MERIPIWNLVLYKNNIDWDFPYTTGSVIFMTQRRLEHFLNKYANGDSDDMSGIKITLTHEYLHILQRKNVKAFQSFYEIFWGFKPIPEGTPNPVVSVSGIIPTSSLNPVVSFKSFIQETLDDFILLF